MTFIFFQCVIYLIITSSVIENGSYFPPLLAKMHEKESGKQQQLHFIVGERSKSKVRG